MHDQKDFYSQIFKELQEEFEYLRDALNKRDFYQEFLLERKKFEEHIKINKGYKDYCRKAFQKLEEENEDLRNQIQSSVDQRKRIESVLSEMIEELIVKKEENESLKAKNEKLIFALDSAHNKILAKIEKIRYLESNFYDNI